MRNGRARRIAAGLTATLAGLACAVLPSFADADHRASHAASRAMWRAATAQPTDPRSRAAAASDCPGVIFIGARGSGEEASAGTHGMGPSVDHMARRLQGELAPDGESMRFLPVVYDALPTRTLAPSKRQLALLRVAPLTAATSWYRHNLRKYLKGLDAGVDAFVAEVKQTVAACPDTDLVAGGYSQGAMVVHQGESRLRGAGDTDETDAIVGTLLLADGDRAPGTRAKLIGSAARRGEGVRPYLHLVKPRDVIDPADTVEICNAGDLVCDYKSTRLLHADRAATTHTSYLKRHVAQLDRAVDWINELF